jgi:hypothetical protein
MKATENVEMWTAKRRRERGERKERRGRETIVLVSFLLLLHPLPH